MSLDRILHEPISGPWQEALQLHTHATWLSYSNSISNSQEVVHFYSQPVPAAAEALKSILLMHRLSGAGRN